MSDYMFMLESHLSTEQNRVVAEVQVAAAEAGVSLFLTGGAMRDMLGGFEIRDLDFTVEGSGLKLAKTIEKKTGARIVAEDDLRKSAELVFPGGITVGIGMARQERYPKPGGRPQVTPASIHEDLRSRDFTINAIALSLNRASRGLLIDPTNGLADLERKELRTVHNYALYDDPVRILRLVRLRVRLGFTVEERTQNQYNNAREAGMEDKVAPRRLFEELRNIANDPNPAEVVRVFDAEKLLTLFSPSLAGPKLNLQGLAKLMKARQLVPFGAPFPVENLGLFLNLLTEKLTPKEKTALAEGLAMEKPEIDLWLKLDARAKKLETALKEPKLHRPSGIYELLLKAPGEEILYLLVRSQLRLVQDRIRNYLQKYVLQAQEITDEAVEAAGFERGTPKFEKAKREMIAAHLNARPKKPAPEEELPAEPAPPPPAAAPRPEPPVKRAFGRRQVGR